MTITEPTLEEQITSAFRDSTAKFQQNAPVVEHLNNRWGMTRQQLGSVASHLNNMASPPLQREAMEINKKKMLQDALEFFTLWRNTAIEDGAALLYRQTLPPQPDPPNPEEVFNGILTVMRKQRGFIFRAFGKQLSVYPASKLTADERGFLTANKAKIHERISQEEDTWLF